MNALSRFSPPYTHKDLISPPLTRPYFASTMASISIGNNIPFKGLSVGQTFKDMDSAWYITTAAIAARGQSYKVRTGNTKVWEAICRQREKYHCDFKIRITNRKGIVKLVTLIPHRCPPSCHDGWSVPKSVRFLSRHHTEPVRVDRNTKPRTIQTGERMHHKNKINYMQAWRTRKHCRGVVDGDTQLQFALIGPLLHEMEKTSSGKVYLANDFAPHMLQDTDDGAYVRYFIDSDLHFNGYFIAPHACIRSQTNHHRPFVCFDGGHIYCHRLYLVWVPRLRLGQYFIYISGADLKIFDLQILVFLP